MCVCVCRVGINVLPGGVCCGMDQRALFSQLFIERQLKVLSPLSPEQTDLIVCVYENDNIYSTYTVNYIIGYF